MRITRELLLYQHAKPSKSLCMSVGPVASPTRAGRQGDHARRLPFTIAASPDSVAATTAPLIRIRAPLANSISITVFGRR
jgi:hypothetical protein